MDFLQRVRTNYFKICVESEKTLKSQGKFILFYFILFYFILLFYFIILFYFIFYLFMIVTHREREAETQAEREAGSMHREPDMGLHPGSLESCPGPKAGAKPLRHPGIPSQGNFKKENYIWGHHMPDYSLYYNCGHQDSVVLAQKQTHRSMEQNRTQKWTLNFMVN